MTYPKTAARTDGRGRHVDLGELVNLTPGQAQMFDSAVEVAYERGLADSAHLTAPPWVAFLIGTAIGIVLVAITAELVAP